MSLLYPQAGFLCFATRFQWLWVIKCCTITTGSLRSCEYPNDFSERNFIISQQFTNKISSQLRVAIPSTPLVSSLTIFETPTNTVSGSYLYYVPTLSSSQGHQGGQNKNKQKTQHGHTLSTRKRYADKRQHAKHLLETSSLGDGNGTLSSPRDSWNSSVTWASNPRLK